MFNFSGKRPSNLGVQSGQLATCPKKPNCVSSFATNKLHGIAPLQLGGDIDSQKQIILDVLSSINGITIVEQSENYLYAECKTPFMGYVDDLEFYWPEGGDFCHVRSASRLGYGDMGVNRK